jgi:hypothetical protein
MKGNCIHNMLLAATAFCVTAHGVRAQSDGEVAKQLVNPFTDVVRVPVELPTIGASAQSVLARRIR